MKKDVSSANPYLLLTPGPLSTTRSVKQAMLQDWCTWDDDYNTIVQSIRKQITQLATGNSGYTSVLMQGSGSFGVEATLTTAVPPAGKLLVITNGAYGDRMAEIAKRCRIQLSVLESDETRQPDLDHLTTLLQNDSAISHVAVVHCETTTGLLNPIEKIGRIVKRFGKIYIVDAMSSFGGIPMDVHHLQIDYLVSSANKCIQGVPGFSFVIAWEQALRSTKNQARSLALDLYDQWETMEQKQGKWRFTSPTHTVRAFAQALKELKEEGGVPQRFERYRKNHEILVTGMQALGFQTLLENSVMSPVITSFLYPDNLNFTFNSFYRKLKEKGFVIYPGKVSKGDTFRIGTIGDVHSTDIQRLLETVKLSIDW